MIRYEWDIETTDQNGDILDHDHRDTYADALRVSLLTDEPHNIVLVRDVIDSDGDLTDRSWAYMDGGKLPEYFQDSAGNDYKKVPTPIHAQVARANRLMKIKTF
jgi:hypothetical protein